MGGGIRGWHTSRDARYRYCLRPLQHRDAVRVCAGLNWSLDPALSGTGAASRIPLSGGPTCAGHERDFLPASDGWFADSYVAAFLRMAHRRTRNLFLL